MIASPVSRELYVAVAPHGYLGHKWLRAHKAELASLGIDPRERAHRRVHRRALAAAILSSLVAGFCFFVILGFVIEIAKGKPTGVATFWSTAVLVGVAAALTVILARRLWSRVD